MKPVSMQHLMDDVPAGTANEAVENGRVAGDCLRASLASILELPIGDVPHFVQYRGADDSHLWWWALVGWCFTMGIDARYIDGETVPKGWSLVDGRSPRGHAHVCVGFDGEVIFDPHPSRSGLPEIEGYVQLIPITDAAKEVLARRVSRMLADELTREAERLGLYADA